jgi:hypothetical protein
LENEAKKQGRTGGQGTFRLLFSVSSDSRSSRL